MTFVIILDVENRSKTQKSRLSAENQCIFYDLTDKKSRLRQNSGESQSKILVSN
jgi:hypothetical protein